MQNLIGAKFPHFLPFAIRCRMKLVILYKVKHLSLSDFQYHKVESSNMSCLEAHVGFFRLLMKGIFGPYVQK